MDDLDLKVRLQNALPRTCTCKITTLAEIRQHDPMCKFRLLSESQVRIEVLSAALLDLITLKDYRDWHGKTPEYLEKKPLAWQQARDVLGLSKAPLLSTEQHHIIPPITDPLGKHWEQPDRTEIKIDDDIATMSQRTFDKLSEYSASQPTRAYDGKMWKSHVRGVWYLRWFGPAEQSDMMLTSTRYIQIEEPTGDGTFLKKLI